MLISKREAQCKLEICSFASDILQKAQVILEVPVLSPAMTVLDNRKDQQPEWLICIVLGWPVAMMSLHAAPL